ncbi:MAG: hypothetical protein Q7J86_00800 [Bacteroidota bacterium]|nr:hypothetical protein [Bacteroidota bacterium]
MQKAIYFLLFFLIAASGFGQKFEAESATLSGGAIKTALASASGSYIRTIKYRLFGDHCTKLPADGSGGAQKALLPAKNFGS